MGRSSPFRRGARWLVIACIAGSSLLAARGGDDAAQAAFDAGLSALRARNHIDAVAAFERSLELRPDDPETLFRLGMARGGLQDWPAAAEAYRRALELDPARAQAAHNLGNVYYRQGRYDDAAAAYALALEIDPAYIGAAFLHGRVLRELNRGDEAQGAFDRCLAASPRNDREKRIQVDCLFYLGTLRYRDGDFQGAASMMEQVLYVFRAHPEARYYLAMSYRRLGRLDEAKEQLEIHRTMLQALRKDPIEKQADP
jgi:Flp pilus assembly protein TadD